MIKRIIPETLLILLLSIFVSSCSYRSVLYYPKLSKSGKASIAKRIDNSINTVDSNLNIGIKIVSLKTGETIYEKNSYNLFNPASNLKLFTAAAALHYLGPYYRFNTKVYIDSNITPVINGNLYLKGDGDPDFNMHGLEDIVNQIKILGVKRIKGDLIVDDTIFDSDSLGPGWMWDDGSYWFFAQINALTINDNCVKIIVKPGNNVNDPPEQFFYPNTEYVSINNEAVTVNSVVSDNKLEVERRWRYKQNVIDLTGEININEAPKAYIRTVENPPLYTGTLFKELLGKNNIDIEGLVRKDTLPPDSRLLALHISDPLQTSIINFLKISDNLTGELLLKKIGALFDSSTGTWNNGARAIKTFIHNNVKIDTTKLELVDGSGVSRYNLINANQLVQLLQWIYNNFKIYPEIAAALPISGGDGTLNNRLKKVASKSIARAKTGTLQGVTSLAGYTLTSDNELVAFSIMMSGFVNGNDKYTHLQDKIISDITEFTRF